MGLIICNSALFRLIFHKVETSNLAIGFNSQNLDFDKQVAFLKNDFQERFHNLKSLYAHSK